MGAPTTLRWPTPLPPGGTIGVCSPAGPVDTALLDAGIPKLRARGYRVLEAPHARDRHPGRDYLAGTDDARLDDLHTLFLDPDVDLILCARGGYGTMRFLDRLDYDAIRARPKPLVGYSDITALQLALARRAGLISFSGIMATAGYGFGQDTLDPWSEASFWAAVGDAGETPVAGRPEDDGPWDVLRAPASGVVSGPLYPVCLTLLTSLLGTPYVPDLRGAILVIEDIYEAADRIDRCLTQLRLAGILDGLSALFVGSFNGTGEDDALRRDVPALACDLTPPHVAVAAGIAYGHIPRRLTLPVGAWSEVDLARGTFGFPRAETT